MKKEKMNNRELDIVVDDSLEMKKDKAKKEKQSVDDDNTITLRNGRQFKRRHYEIAEDGRLQLMNRETNYRYKPDAEKNIELNNGKIVKYDKYKEAIARIDSYVKEKYQQVSLKIRKSGNEDILQYLYVISHTEGDSAAQHVIDLLRKDYKKRGFSQEYLVEEYNRRMEKENSK